MGGLRTRTGQPSQSTCLKETTLFFSLSVGSLVSVSTLKVRPSLGSEALLLHTQKKLTMPALLLHYLPFASFLFGCGQLENIPKTCLNLTLFVIEGG